MLFMKEVKCSTLPAANFEMIFVSPGYLHPVCSELDRSGIRVASGDCSVTKCRRLRICIRVCTQNITHTEVLCMIWFRTQRL